MRHVLLALSVFCLLLATYVVVVHLPEITGSDKEVTHTPGPDLSDYFAEKGTALLAAATDFNQILTQGNVLGISDEKEKTSEKASGNNVEEINNIKHANPLPKKSEYIIAVLGDSMVDTLGPSLPHLLNALKVRLPKVNFKLLNYGAGATNIESGLSRLTNDYSYLGENKPALLSQNPDIVVIESFAYNHWDNTQADWDRQWLAIAHIIDTIKEHNPDTQIVLSAAVAPFCPTYTDGSANLPPERKFVECDTVKRYLQNIVNFAKGEGYLLADAFHPSMKGSEGNPLYINQSDHIHPSNEGKTLFSSYVVEAIKQLIP